MRASAERQDTRLDDPLPVVRQTVRSLLLSSPAYRALDRPTQRSMAESMVKVCARAASLIREEVESTREGDRRPGGFATTQSAGSDFSGVAAQRVADTTRQTLNAVSFPRFVTDLINGVFRAISDSGIQQMNAFVDLLNNVAAATDDFADSNMGPDRARQWLVEKYPRSFQINTDDSSDGATVQLRDGAQMPPEGALRTDLGLGPSDSVPSGDPEALLPLVRVSLARQRQQMLASMVMMGMQRIVIESGRITAAMHFHIDTRSAAQDDQASRFSEQNEISARGSYGVGPWGVSASIQNTIGYVSTQRSQTTEEMNTDLDLSSSVEINFKSDYLPLNRLASSSQVSQIRNNSLNPEAEAQIAAQERTQRSQLAAQSDRERLNALDREIGSSPSTTPSGSTTAPQPAAGATSGGAGGAPARNTGVGQPTGTPATRPSQGTGTAGGGGTTQPAGGAGTTQPAGEVSAAGQTTTGAGTTATTGRH